MPTMAGVVPGVSNYAIDHRDHGEINAAQAHDQRSDDRGSDRAHGVLRTQQQEQTIGPCAAKK